MKKYPHNVSCSVMHYVERFTWDKESKTFSCEISTLMHGRQTFLDTIYTDAADLGFALYNSKTGNRVVYHQASVERKNGEIISWTFEPTYFSVSHHPQAAGTKVIIFND